MIALDTNVVVRVLTRDDVAQAERAAEVMASGPLWLAKTVLVEIERVLRKGYGFDRAAVNRALTLLLGLENLSVEDAAAAHRLSHVNRPSWAAHGTKSPHRSRCHTLEPRCHVTGARSGHRTTLDARPHAPATIRIHLLSLPRSEAASPWHGCC